MMLNWWLLFLVFQLQIIVMYDLSLYICLLVWVLWVWGEHGLSYQCFLERRLYLCIYIISFYAWKYSWVGCILIFVKWVLFVRYRFLLKVMLTIPDENSIQTHTMISEWCISANYYTNLYKGHKKFKGIIKMNKIVSLKEWKFDFLSC